MKFAKINEALLTFFYVGKIRIAPGTLGSIAAIILWLMLNLAFNAFATEKSIQNLILIGLIAVFILIGLVGIRSYSIKCHEFDHQSIVLDEVIGMLTTLQLAFLGNESIQNFDQKLFWIAVFFCFAFFRYFDIFKPGAIGILDKKLKNSFGVIFDDILSAIIAGGLANLSLSIGRII